MALRPGIGSGSVEEVLQTVTGGYKEVKSGFAGGSGNGDFRGKVGSGLEGPTKHACEP